MNSALAGDGDAAGAPAPAVDLSKPDVAPPMSPPGADEPIWAMGSNGLPVTEVAPLFPPPPAPERHRISPRDVLIEIVWALAVAAIVAGLGVPLGWLWATVSPHVVLEMTASGPSFTQPNPEGYVGGESVYLLICVAVGLLTSIAVWMLGRRRRGPVVLVGLAAGSIAGALLMAWLGHKIGLADYERLLKSAPVGSRFEVPVKVRSTLVYRPVVLGVALDVPLVRGAGLVQAMIAVATYTVMAGFSTSGSLRPRPRRRDGAEPPVSGTDRPEPFSSDSPEPPGLQAAPAPPAAG